MRVRLQPKLKPNNYTETCMIDEADGWRGRNVWYPGRPVWNASKEATTVQAKGKAVLNAQESAEVIVAERRRTESVGVLSITEKGGVTIYDRKH